MTKKEPKDKRMTEIILAAVDEFLEKGYDRASMEAIAQRAGISKGGLYHHFRSKDEILLFANQKLNEPVTGLMRQARQKPNASEGLAWYIERYLKYWHDRKKELAFYSLSMSKMLDHPRLWRMYQGYIDSYTDLFKGFYEKGIAQGEFIPHSAYDSALVLIAALDGIATYLIISEGLNLDRIISLFQERFVRSYRNSADASKI